MNFGLFLKQLREKKEMTIRQLAMYANVSHGYLSQVERGERGTPSPEILSKLAGPLGVSYEELMTAAGYLNGSSTVESVIAKNKKLYDVIARAKDLPDQNLEEITDTLDTLIELHLKRLKNKKSNGDNK
ncbi:helix-turn-helix domain-containing protein [Desulforamulus putei]|nr:helix-turn-helix transcriptional regulator [Desulforamulus putei]